MNLDDLIFAVTFIVMGAMALKGWNTFQEWRFNRFMRKEHKRVAMEIKDAIRRNLQYGLPQEGDVEGVFNPGPTAPITFIVRQQRAENRENRDEADLQAAINALIGKVREGDAR